MRAIKLIAGLAALALLVAGCGGGAKTPTVAHLGSSTSSSSSPAGAGSSTSSSGGSQGSSASQDSQAVAYSACVRAHGVPNFPDPKISTNGNEVKVAIGINPSISGNPHFKSAQQACSKLLPERRARIELQSADQPAGTVAVPEGGGLHPLARDPELPGPDVLRRRRALAEKRRHRLAFPTSACGGGSLPITDPRRPAR